MLFATYFISECTYRWIVQQPKATPRVDIAVGAKPFFEIGQLIIREDPSYIMRNEAGWSAPAGKSQWLQSKKYC